MKKATNVVLVLCIAYLTIGIVFFWGNLFRGHDLSYCFQSLVLWLPQVLL